MPRSAIALTLCVLAAGCGDLPYDRVGTWRPAHSADENIAAQVVNASDLVEGTPYRPIDSTMPAAAVLRYRTNRIKPLPDSGISQINISGNGNSNSSPSGGSAAPDAGSSNDGQQ